MKLRSYSTSGGPASSKSVKFQTRITLKCGKNRTNNSPINKHQLQFYYIHPKDAFKVQIRAKVQRVRLVVGCTFLSTLKSGFFLTKSD